MLWPFPSCQFSRHNRHPKTLSHTEKFPRRKRSQKKKVNVTKAPSSFFFPERCFHSMYSVCFIWASFSCKNIAWLLPWRRRLLYVYHTIDAKQFGPVFLLLLLFFSLLRFFGREFRSACQASFFTTYGCTVSRQRVTQYSRYMWRGNAVNPLGFDFLI